MFYKLSGYPQAFMHKPLEHFLQQYIPVCFLLRLPLRLLFQTGSLGNPRALYISLVSRLMPVVRLCVPGYVLVVPVDERVLHCVKQKTIVAPSPLQVTTMRV